MHQAKVEEAVQQAKALRKAMETGKIAQTVSIQRPTSKPDKTRLVWWTYKLIQKNP